MKRAVQLLFGARLYSFLLFFAVSALCAQTPTVEESITLVENNLLPSVQFADTSYIRFTIGERMQMYNVPSVSIAVINNGKIEWAKAYGVADKEHNTPATTTTMYQAASMSKSVNAVCVMTLVQEGKLSLDTDIRQYLKTWTFPDNEFSTGKKITLRNLLSHTAGLSTHGFGGYAPGDSLPSINQILDGVSPANSEAVRPIALPNEKSIYSGGGTVISQKILQDNIDSDYAHLVWQRVLEPLHMTHSTFAQPLPAALVQNVATGYDSDGEEIKGKYHIYPEQAPAGLWTTPTDFAHFILAVQHSLKNDGTGILRDTLARELLAVIPGSDGAATGFSIRERGGEKYFSHGGSNEGFKSHYYGSFSSGRGAVVMINSDQYDIIPEIISSIATVYNWKDCYQPTIKKLALPPDSLLQRYTGTYQMKRPELTFTVRSAGNYLEVTADGKTYERMYFTSDTSFILLSADYLEYEFAGSHPAAADTLLVRQGDAVFTATR